ncbi:MAG: hypothetical protein GY758_00585 [Fuerstiella sp.]|nr:hypothetical protein [Fuerstiella sp.]
MTEHDERLLQRCIDGEISAEQRAELIRQLDAAPERWKALACSYMEDQLIAGGIRHSVAAVQEPREPQLLRRNEKPHWFHHPLMSVALSACVAFLGGVLISREISSGGNAGAGNVVSGASSGNSVADPGTVAADLVSEPDYSLRLEADGTISRELPVFDDATRFMSEFERYRQQMKESLRDDHRVLDSRGSRIQLIQLRMDDGRTVVIPFEETQISPRLQ